LAWNDWNDQNNRKAAMTRTNQNIANLCANGEETRSIYFAFLLLFAVMEVKVAPQYWL
jgi:hypothetical protein